MTDLKLWIVIAALGVGSFLLRFSFLGLIGNRPMPEWLLRHLRYTGVAFLPALVGPLVIWSDGPASAIDWAQIIAGLVTVATGWWSGNVLVAILAGISALALAGWVF